ncbi:hypothetical protein SUNI508_13387 [Seiridium unicorne]|uniref:Alpha/beta-hydrolase n=1 Tax=Seiridium unicorne TaxID=138068 RepID=A0ABR2VD64_9PEZI
MGVGLFSMSGAQKEPNTGRNRSRKLDAAVSSTKFYGSQVGGKSVINYGYTDMPMKLLLWDIRTFFTFSYALPWVIWPITPGDNGEFAELAVTRGNMFCIFMHVVLIALQLGFLLVVIPVCILLPVWMAMLGVGAFFALNWMLVLALNGNSLTYTSDPKYAPALAEHAHEKWIFINGVAAGEAWMKSNINRLALTFKRPIEGIHNKTTGIIFDVIECLIQRNFGYATQDVREAYKTVKEHLYNPGLSKVVFILHSQGGIEGGLVLDWLLQELPQDLLAKLEVYTFGCAANHFNNPHRHVESQKAEQKNPNSLTLTNTTMTQSGLTHSPVEMRTPSLSKQSTSNTGKSSRSGQEPPTPPNAEAEGSQTQKFSTGPSNDRVIGHIEHYAHTTDFVALWGVLHFVTSEMASPLLPRFMGRVFSRTSSRGGHQFCQHYLEGMFPLEEDATGKLVGCKNTNDFMESSVEQAKAGTELEDIREGIQNNMAMIAGRHDSSVNPEVAVHGSFNDGKLIDGDVKVKDLSRLWLYRNGKSPPELPQGLAPDADGVVRAGTL